MIAARALRREYRIRLIDLLSSGTSITRRGAFVFRSLVHITHGEGKRERMVNRKGVFIGAYVPRDLKETLQRRAAAEHRTLSQEITRILTEAVHGKQLPPGMVDRRAVGSPLRRRDTDPPERRRRGDLPVGKGEPPSDSGGES
jgi:plasmid stability protein